MHERNRRERHEAHHHTNFPESQKRKSYFNEEMPYWIMVQWGVFVVGGLHVSFAFGEDAEGEEGKDNGGGEVGFAEVEEDEVDGGGEPGGEEAVAEAA